MVEQLSFVVGVVLTKVQKRILWLWCWLLLFGLLPLKEDNKQNILSTVKRVCRRRNWNYDITLYIYVAGELVLLKGTNLSWTGWLYL